MVEAYLDWFTGHWHGLRSAAVTIAESDEGEPRERLEARQLVGLLDLAAGARSRAERQLREVASEYAQHHHVEPEDLAVPAALARLYLSEGAIEKARLTTGPALAAVAEKGLWPDRRRPLRQVRYQGRDRWGRRAWARNALMGRALRWHR